MSESSSNSWSGSRKSEVSVTTSANAAVVGGSLVSPTKRFCSSASNAELTTSPTELRTSSQKRSGRRASAATWWRPRRRKSLLGQEHTQKAKGKERTKERTREKTREKTRARARTRAKRRNEGLGLVRTTTRIKSPSKRPPSDQMKVVEPASRVGNGGLESQRGWSCREVTRPLPPPQLPPPPLPRPPRRQPEGLDPRRPAPRRPRPRHRHRRRQGPPPHLLHLRVWRLRRPRRRRGTPLVVEASSPDDAHSNSPKPLLPQRRRPRARPLQRLPRCLQLQQQQQQQPPRLLPHPHPQLLHQQQQPLLHRLQQQQRPRPVRPQQGM
mmetsp:Transcript_71890/g.156590  ORF Transcript_71890/g.156590 Transcript_71890/m.156590 type:complete len:325 (-) Transcript_71890:1983-2957(-)